MLKDVNLLIWITFYLCCFVEGRWIRETAQCPLLDVFTSFEYKSVVKHSNIATATVIMSEIESSELNKSKILYSVVDRSYVAMSILNATYDDPRLNELETEEMFCKRDEFCFNRIHESFVINSVIGNHHECKWRPNNSTVISSSVELSGLQNSVVLATRMLESVACSSLITESNIRKGTKVLNSGLTVTNASASGIFNSRTQNSIIEASCISDSDVCTSLVRNSSTFYASLENANVTLSTIPNSKIVESEVSKSNITESNIVSCNKIYLSDIRNSLIRDKSEVLNSKVYNSTVINSTLVDLFIVNAEIKDENLIKMRYNK